MNDLSLYIKHLVNPKSSIDKETQTKLIQYLFDIFLQYQKDLLMVTDGYISVIKSRVAFETLANIQLKNKYPDIAIKSYDDEKKKYRWNIKISDIYDVITSVNHFSILRYESDLFADGQTIEKNRDNSTITVITNRLHIKAPNELDKTYKTDEEEQEAIKRYDEIISDYKKHFKYFDELLKLIIDMRLAKKRKGSFLHLRVGSNWGKSFLSALLKKLEIGFEIDYHNLMNKGANDIAPIQVRNSFVLLIDEFNVFSNEMLKLSHSFAFAPKFGMREEIELYLKILFSAENSPSFVGGVDPQIYNRVMVMDLPDNETVKLDDRAIYNKYGNARYMMELTKYAYFFLSERLFEYLKMEKYEAHKKADLEVAKALKKFEMKGVVNLNEMIKDELNIAIDEILSYSYEADISPIYRDIAQNIFLIKSGKYEGKIFIKSPAKTLEHILKRIMSEQEYKKAKYKLTKMEDILNIVADYRLKNFRVNGKPKKGIIISRNYNQILQELQTQGNLIIEKKTNK